MLLFTFSWKNLFFLIYFHTIDVMAEKAGLAVNVSKTKNMALSDSPLMLKCKDKAFDQIKEFKCIRSWWTLKHRFEETQTMVMICTTREGGQMKSTKKQSTAAAWLGPQKTGIVSATTSWGLHGCSFKISGNANFTWHPLHHSWPYRI
jgi:hypothetical protein